MRTRIDKIVEAVLCLLIVGMVLAFGAVQPVAYAIMQAVLFALLILVLIQQSLKGRIQLPLPLWPCLFALLVGFQLVPLPPELLSRLSPPRAVEGTLQGLGDFFAAEVWRPLSIYPRETLAALTRFMAYLAAFVLAARSFDSSRRRSAIVFTLIALGCFEAAYGIFQYLTGWQKIFTYEKRYYLQEATGTYINRNHFAGFLEMVIPLTVALGFHTYQLWSQQRHPRGPKRMPLSWSSAGLQSLFYIFLTVVMVLAVIFSRSRGGILATVFSVLLVALLAQVRLKERGWLVAILVAFVGIAGYALWIGLGPVLDRFEQMSGEEGYLPYDVRIPMWTDALGLVRDYPLFGTGLGTFVVAYRPYQTTLVLQLADHAHNDYLQFAAETGLIGLALLFVPIFYLAARMMVSFLSDSRRYRRAVTLGCMGSTLAILLHSFTDFNLQIPANALVFSVVLGIGYKAACLEPRDEVPSASADMKVKVEKAPLGAPASPRGARSLARQSDIRLN